MADKASHFTISDQPALFQLLVSILIIMIAGSLFLLFFLFAGSLIFGTGYQELLKIPSPDESEKGLYMLKYVQASQHLALFIIPAGIILYMMQIPEQDRIRDKSLPGTIAIVLVIILAFFILPITSLTGTFNSQMHLPDWISGVEVWMKEKEDTASLVTRLLISSDNLKVLVINIFVLSVLPAIGEEFLFRGIIQKIFCRMFKSGHIAIWITSLIFSAMHFQFFGFIPRLILGLIFGYLYYWSGTLLLPVIAHFVNNAVPVVATYFVGWDRLNNQSFLLAKHPIIIPVLSIIIITVILFYFWTKRINNSITEINIIENPNI
jgi:uncharacterized protein